MDVARVYDDLGENRALRALIDRLWRGAIQGTNDSFDLNTDPSVAGQRFIGECTQSCGTHHPFMRSWVQVIPKDKSNARLARHHGLSTVTAKGSS